MKPTKKPAPLLKSPRNKRANISFSILIEQRDALDELARKKGMNRSALAQLAISRLLEKGI